MASERAARDHGSHNQHRIRAKSSAERKYNRRNDRTHPPVGAGCKSKHRAEDEHCGREDFRKQIRLRDFDDVVGHAHSGGQILQNKRDKKQCQRRQHVGKAAHHAGQELIQRQNLSRNIKEEAQDQRENHGRKNVVCDDCVHNERAHRNQKIPDVAFSFILLKSLVVIFTAALGVDLTGLFDALVGFFHRSELRHPSHAEQEDDNQRDDRVKQIRYRHRISLHRAFHTERTDAVLLIEETRVKRSPGRERQQHTDGRTGGIEQVGQRLTRQLLAVTDFLHAGADRKNIQIIVDENQDAHEEGGEQCFALGVADFRDVSGKAEASSRIGQKSDQSAEKQADQHDPDVFREHILQGLSPPGKKPAVVNKDGSGNRAGNHEFQTALRPDSADNDTQCDDDGCKSKIHSGSFPAFCAGLACKEAGICGMFCL